MELSVTGRHLALTESLKAYAEEKIGASVKVLDGEHMSAEVILHVERNRSIARRCVCEVTINAKGHVIRVEEADEDMHAAIDVAAAKVVRQMRKYKNRVIERKTQADAPAYRAEGAELDLDALMDELSADEEIVRVKEIEFAPMTEEEALIQIDLLGHDFFAYTDRDSNAVCVLYRRKNGGYGILKQA